MRTLLIFVLNVLDNVGLGEAQLDECSLDVIPGDFCWRRRTFERRGDGMDGDRAAKKRGESGRREDTSEEDVILGDEGDPIKPRLYVRAPI